MNKTNHSNLCPVSDGYTDCCCSNPIKPSEVSLSSEWEILRAGYEEVQMVKSSIEDAYPEAYRLARKFHELYEEQAPFFGYITNPNTREFYPNSNNARLMAYVCYTIISEVRDQAILQERLRLKEKIESMKANDTELGLGKERDQALKEVLDLLETK